MLDVRITAHQPLALGVRPAGTAPVATHLHIPGSVLRGALAAAWLLDHGPLAQAPTRARREFLALFEGQVAYGPLFAPGSHVVPLSVLRCKYRQCGLVVDEAFPGQETRPCPCGPLEPGRGAVEFAGPGRGQRVTENTRLQIDDRTGVAEEGLLFTRRALAHRDAQGGLRTFHGRLSAGSDLPEAAARWLASTRRLRLGGRRSTSGSVTFTAHRAERPRPVSGQRLALRLTAPAVLTDASGLPLDPADLRAVREALRSELSPLLGGAEVTAVERVWARRERVGGWHAASRLPKPVELAVSAGSVLLLAFDRPPAPEALGALAARGLGLRRHEGFGALEVASTSWVPPAGTEPAPDGASGSDPAERPARLLHSTGHAAWFLDQLRPYVLQPGDGPAGPATALLGRPQLRRLTPSQRQEVTDLLENASAELLDRVLLLLEALHRFSTDGAPSS
ncbi:type III-B CRISPR module-associated Cmr3 family protein [Streptomyces sp. NPDC002454]